MLRHITVDRINDPVDIYAKDDARIFASILGDEGIHNIGSNMQAEAVGSNQLRIKDGVASVQGHIAIIDPGDDETVTLDVGVSGYKRNDLVVLDFTKTGENDEITLKVVKGKQGTVATDPTFVQQDLTKGGTHRQVPLWRVCFNGTLIESVVRYESVIPNLSDLVKEQDGSIDLDNGVDLSIFMAKAKNFISFRKVTGRAHSKGIPDSTATYCFYTKLRTHVIGYRASDASTWFAMYTNNVLGEFTTYILPSDVTDAVDVTIKGTKVADAVAIKTLTDNLKKTNTSITELGKTTVSKTYIGSTDLVPMTNMEQWARSAGTDTYSFFRKPTGVRVTNGIPDSDATTCFYVRMGTYVIGHRSNDMSVWFAGFYNDALSPFVEMTTNSCVKYAGNNGADLAANTHLPSFLPLASNYTIYRKDATVKVSGDLPNSDSKYCFFIKMGTFVLGYSTNGHTYIAQALNNTMTDWCELPNSQGELSQIMLNQTGTGQLSLLKLARNGSVVMVMISEADGSVRLAMYNGMQYVSTPIRIYRNGTVDLGDFGADKGTVKNLTTTNTTASQMTTDVIDAELVKVLAKGTDQATLIDLSRNGARIMLMMSEVDGSVRFAMYNGPNYLNSPLLLRRNGNVEMAGTLLMGTSTYGDGLVKLFANNPLIEFHYGRVADFTARIVQPSSNILRFEVANTSNQKAIVELYKSNTTANPIAEYRPTSDGDIYLGDATHKWNSVYAVNTQIQSDKKTKREIADIAQAVNFIMGLEAKQYKLKNSDTAEGRLHYGFIAQDIAKLADALEVGDLSMYQAAVMDVDEEGNAIEGYYEEEVKDKNLAWTLNYSEIIAPLVATVQYQQSIIIDMQADIQALKEMMKMGA